MAYKFFLSHARFDVDKQLKKFHDDLVKEVGRLTGQWEEAGFRDARDIELGTWWEAELSKALQTARVFVYLCSPTYVRREWCGKEWECFRRRLNAYWREHPELTAPPPLMLPILWVPTPDLPSVIDRAQLHQEDLGEFYKENGLYQLMKRNPRQYPTVLNKIAQAIMHTSVQHPLPSWPFPADFKQVATPFVPPTSPGPTTAQFVYGVGPETKFQGRPETIAAHDNIPSKTWKPYYPPADELAAEVAWRAVAREKLDYEEIPLDDRVVNYILEAESKNKIVVLLVDVWTLQSAKYRELMETYEKNRRRNCAVVVIWNDQDPETVRQSELLQQTLWSTFDRAFAALANSPNELHSVVVRKLIQHRKCLLEWGSVMKPVEGGDTVVLPGIRSVK
jgi:FxsC-like protein